jgi:hypothetical protein
MIPQAANKRGKLALPFTSWPSGMSERMYSLAVLKPPIQRFRSNELLHRARTEMVGIALSILMACLLGVSPFGPRILIKAEFVAVHTIFVAHLISPIGSRTLRY